MWRWNPRVLEPVLVLKGVAFKDLVGEELRIYLKVNGMDRPEPHMDGPEYVAGLIHNGQFSRGTDQPSEGFFYYVVDPVLIFHPEDMVMIEYDEGGNHVVGYPEYELRQVMMA